MKKTFSRKSLCALLVAAGVFLAGISAQAQTLNPTITNSAAVNAILDGRTNWALASRGATSFASSCLGTAYTNTLVNDGVVANGWIASTVNNGEFVGVAFTNAGGITLGALVYYGWAGGRSDGTWSLQYTTNAAPNASTPNSAWSQIGTYTFTGAGVMSRSIFEFAAISNVTGVRLVISNATGLQKNVQELEAYSPPTVPSMTPVASGSGAATYIGTRTNWALASNGSTASCLSFISGYGPELAIDGNYANNAYLPASVSSNEFLIVAFSNSITLGAASWGGSYANRSVGFYELDYTTNIFGGGTTNWTAIGRYYFPEGAGGVNGTVMPRSVFEMNNAIANVTGLRLRFLYPASASLGTLEFEAYSPAPPAITTPPANRTVGIGDSYTFTVVGTGATSYQWQKNGTNILNATNSSLALVNAQFTDAGSYAVVLANLYGSVTSAPPAVLTVVQTTPPSITGSAVSSMVSGRINLALASQGSTSFASSCLATAYTNTLVNDGSIANAWIAATKNDGQYVGVAFTNTAGVTLGALAFTGWANDRSYGIWALQYTTNASPGTNTPASAWTQISLYSWPSATPMPRSYFEFPAISNVTGVRLVCTNAYLEPNVQELEAYAPALPVVTTPPTGGTAYVGDSFTFTVVGTSAVGYQWQKDGVNLAGATATNLTFGYVQPTNAGAYTVVLTNINGAVTSTPLAVLMVTNYASYQTAILAENPIHYYPLNDASGSTAVDLGSLNFGGGTYTGGCTLGQPGPTTNGGNSVYFNGAAGTYVNLGLFHPGNEMTVECWANLDADARTSFNSVFARWDASYDFSIANSAPSFTTVNAATNVTTTTISSMTRGNWHHLVGIYRTNGTQTVYKDGVATTAINVAGVLKNLAQTISPDRVLIGSTRNGTNTSFNFKGYIADVAFYDHVVSSNRIVAHYNYTAAAVDTNPPVLTSVASTNGLTIVAVFHETVRGASAMNITNYIVNGGALTVASAALQSDFKTVVLTLASPAGGSFTVAASNVLDVAGNPSVVANVVNGTVLPPGITTQPVGGTVAAGDNFTFSVAGTNAVSYQWQKDGTNIPSATGGSLAFVNVQVGDTGAYTVVLTNPGGSVTSAPPAVLTVTNAVYASYQAAILADNPVHYYPLNDVSGTTATDLGSLNFGGGTYMGGCTLGQPGPATNGGSSVYFNGVAGTYVNLGLFHPGNELTVECWANLDADAAPAYNTVIARWDASYTLFFLANSPWWSAFNAAGNLTQISPGSAPRGNWHHLVGVYQTNGTQTVYKDGVPTTSARAAGVLKSVAGTAVPDRVLIGATGDGTNGALNFKGYIADVAFYDHAVIPGHVLRHYNYATAAVDTNLPVLTSVTSASGTTIHVVFDEAVRNASATNAANYTVNGGASTVTGAVLQSDFKTVVLTLASPIIGRPFTVAAGNVLDVAGNASSAANVVNGNVSQLVTTATLTLSAGNNPSGYTDSLAFTAAVQTNGVVATDATGWVVFATNLVAWETNSAAAGASTSSSLNNLPRGTNLIIAIYSGDANYLASTNTLEQIVTNHPPVANANSYSRNGAATIHMLVSDLLTNATDAIDGDTLTLVGVSMSTNGITLVNDGTYVHYTNASLVNDEFAYTVTDGFGGTNSGVITLIAGGVVTGTSSISGVITGKPTTLTAYGIPGETYITQRATNLDQVVWDDIATNVLSGTNVVISVTDSNPPAESAFYRLKWLQP